MLIATITGATGAAALVGIGFLLEPLGQASEVAQAARHMLFALAPGLIPCLWFQVLRQTTVGLQCPLQLLWVTLGSVALNAALNLALLHGVGPFPALGLAGSGAATSAVHLAQALALLAGGLGAVELAAYNVVNQITYIVFQTAVGTSHAASVLVSRDVATTDPGSARRWAATALTQQAGLLILVGAVYVAFGPFLVRALASDVTEATIALRDRPHRRRDHSVRRRTCRTSPSAS